MESLRRARIEVLKDRERRRTLLSFLIARLRLAVHLRVFSYRYQTAIIILFRLYQAGRLTLVTDLAEPARRTQNDRR